MKPYPTTVPVRLAGIFTPPRARKARSGVVEAKVPVFLTSYADDEVPVVCRREWPLDDPEEPGSGRRVETEFRIVAGRLATRLLVPGTVRAEKASILAQLDPADAALPLSGSSTIFSTTGWSTLACRPSPEGSEVLADVGTADEPTARKFVELTEKFARDVVVIGDELWTLRSETPAVRFWTQNAPTSFPHWGSDWMPAPDPSGWSVHTLGECRLSLEDLAIAESEDRPWLGRTWIDPAAVGFFRADLRAESLFSLRRLLFEVVRNVDPVKAPPAFLRSLADLLEVPGAVDDRLPDPDGRLPERIAVVASGFDVDMDPFGGERMAAVALLSNLLADIASRRLGSEPEREAEVLDDAMIAYDL